ncbi:MAG: cache domain-containing protein [candidate division KSB1 bacterium]|nr:cache domain-containing protein [candidate division KSB1 bacterium]
MSLSLRTKLLGSSVAVVVASGAVVTWLGARLIGDRVVSQAQDKVRTDLNAARALYEEKARDVADLVRLTATRFFLQQALSTHDLQGLRAELMRIRNHEGLDMLTVTNARGQVLFRAGNPVARGDLQSDDPLVASVLASRRPCWATELLPEPRLFLENPELAGRARIPLLPTPHARQRPEAEETTGMMIAAAAPVLDQNGNLIGILYGGTLLNQHYEIVDRIKNTVYQGKVYKGKDIGTATIFQDDLRIATNVTLPDGARAVGTRASEEVYRQVVVYGRPWIGRAFVVHDWYITAYEPIRNLKGDIIGMLYVGMLEAPYRDLRRQVIFTFLGAALASILFLSAVTYVVTTATIRPVHSLLAAMQKIGAGQLSYRVPETRQDELGSLARSLNQMAAQLEQLTESYRVLTTDLERKVQERTKELERTQEQLVQSEKLSSLGKLAAGVAHEINNPLTSIMINAHLLAEQFQGNPHTEESLRLIIEETERCSTIVRGLLEFSRQQPPQREPTDINEVVRRTLHLCESQILMAKVKVRTSLAEDIPRVMVDRQKIIQVFTNLVLNAVDAMPEGGTLTVISRRGSEDMAEVVFADTGCGIPKHILGRIFDPFFTTKEGKGTGLGLSVSYGIVQAHGGTIAVESEEGSGTMVTVRLPLQVVHPGEKGEES